MVTIIRFYDIDEGPAATLGHLVLEGDAEGFDDEMLREALRDREVGYEVIRDAGKASTDPDILEFIRVTFGRP